MALDILGPANAPNSVTARPADDRAFGSTDTWFKDCTSSVANDGTKLKSAFMNAVAAFARGIVRMNGNTAGAVPIVTENNADDAMAVKAIQHMIQRAQPSYGDDTGIVNALVVALSPPMAEYKKGAVVRTIVALSNTGSATINVNSLGAKSIVRLDGSTLAPRDMPAGGLVELVYDGTNFILIGSQPGVLTAPRTYYVATTGSDTNSGLSSGSPFLTVQRALNVISTFNLNGYNVTVNIANGTYAPFSIFPLNGSGNVDIVGNMATPSNVLINSTLGSAVKNFARNVTLRGIKVASSAQNVAGGDPGNGIRSVQGGVLNIANVDFGYCFSNHMGAEGGGSIIVLGAGSDPTYHIDISGGAGGSHMQSYAAGTITLLSPILNVLSAVTIGIAFAQAALSSSIAGSYSTINNPSNVTGLKFSGSLNGVFYPAGLGVNYYPGSAAGVLASGAQYA